jgi:hypothetical protein
MRRIARVATLALVLGLGCGGAQPLAPIAAPPPAAPAESPEKVLAVAFDDIPTRVAAAAPLSLTASDGTGLALVALKARAVLDDPLAFTELALTFENPSDRVLEGTFSIALPQGAAISRFAMKNDAGWQEGEVVEKQQARAAYEDFLHRRQDPALLEQAAGNEFSARVFPIPAHGKKELVVSYSQELTRRRPYVLPLAGLPAIGRVDVEAYAAGKAAPVQVLAKDNLEPKGDFRVDPKLLGDRVGVRSGNLVLARVTPVASSQPEPLGAVVLLVDTSASRALGMLEEGRILRRLCAGIARASGPRTPVVIAAFDQTIEPLFEGAAGDVGDAVVARMRQRLALGASNLGAALAWAGEHARARSIRRVVVLGDGVPTAGETGGTELRGIARSLASSGVERLDAVALGGIRDEALLASLVNAGLPRGGVVVDGAASDEETWRRLNEATRSGLEVRVENASFTFPQRVDGVQAGDEVLVYANVPDELPVRLSVGGGPLTAPSLARVERPLLERAWAGAKLASLVERERVEGPSGALSTEMVGISTRYRVLSPKTSLLVLETDADYQRFGIDRRALGDILVADGSRVSTLQRPPFTPPKPVAVAAAPPAPRGALEKRKDKGGRAAPPRPSPVSVASRPAAKPSPASGGVAANRGLEDFDGGSLSAAAGAPAKMAEAPAPRRASEAKKEVHAPPGVPLVDAPSSAGPARAPAAPPPPAPPAQAAPAPSAAPSPAPAPPSSPARAPAASDDSRRPSPVASEREERAAPSPPQPPAAAPLQLAESARPSAGDPIQAEGGEQEIALPELPKSEPYTGRFKDIMELIARGQVEQAIAAAFDWRKTDPGDVMALVALGEGFEAAGMPLQASRCYGSIIDLFSARADLRRFAGERLERLAHPAALALALDTYQKAEVERPDHPASHRLAAFAWLKTGQPDKAFEAVVRGMRQPYPSGRFRGVDRILREDLGLVGAAWAKADPKRAEEIRARVVAEGGAIEDEPSLRFVLNWETDANDVDFHIYDGKGGHAYYSQPNLPSGGSLYADVTTGYGPECFTIRGTELAYPYRLQAQYYSRGPMGYGMGKLEIVEHDGRGGLTFTERPFVVMLDHAFVDLGVVKRRSALVAGPAR